MERSISDTTKYIPNFRHPSSKKLEFFLLLGLTPGKGAHQSRGMDKTYREDEKFTSELGSLLAKPSRQNYPYKGCPIRTANLPICGYDGPNKHPQAYGTHNEKVPLAWRKAGH